MDKDLSKKVRERISEINHNLVRHMAAKFKYPGSIVALENTSIDTFYKLGIKDLNKIDTLLDKGVWPIVRAGSRSQGNHLYSSNFCLEMYAMHGVKDADKLIYLAEHGITPIHVGSAKFKLGLNFSKMTGQEIEEKVKELYKENFKPETEIKKDYPCNFQDDYIFDDTCPTYGLGLDDFLMEQERI